MEKVQEPDGSSTSQLRRLYRFMAARDFVANRHELVEAGFECTRIDNWLRNGRLVKVARSVYSYGRDIEGPAAIRRTALLLAGPGAALVGGTACEALEIVKPGSVSRSTFEIGSPVGQAREFKGCSPALRDMTFKVSRRDLGPDDLLKVGGLSVARAALALVDFATCASETQIRFAFLEACRLRHFDKHDLEYCYTRLVHRRGVTRLRPYLLLWVPELRRIKSVLEGWFLLVWVTRGYPMPKVNVKIQGFEVDDYWPERNYALELDGDAFHSDPAQKMLDLEKQRVLESHGLTVNRLTYRVFAADPVGQVDRIAHDLGYGQRRR